MITRFYLTIVLLTLHVTYAFAQLASPSTHDVFMIVDFYRITSQNRNVGINLQGENIINNFTIPGSGFHAETFSRALKPGVSYPLTVTRQANVRYGVGIVAPDGFIAEINGELNNSFNIETIVADSVTYQVTLRSLAASQNIFPAGHSSGLRIGDLGWEVGLGKMSNGNGAGFVQLTSKSLTADVFTRSGLGVHLPPHNADDIHDIYQDLNADGISETVRQIRTADCLADFVDTTWNGAQVTGYEIRFYRGGTWNSASGLYSPSGSALATYSISKSAATALTITRADSWGSVTSVVTSAADGALADWQLTETGGNYTRTTSINNTAIAGGRREDTTIAYAAHPSGLPAAATKSFTIRRDYKNMSDTGKVQVQEKLVTETYNQGISSMERTSRFGYWDIVNANNYGLLKWKEDHFGGWNMLGYEDIFYSGAGQTDMHDFLQWSLSNSIYTSVSALAPRQRRLVQEFTPHNDTLNFVLGTTTQSAVVSAYTSGNVRFTEPILGYSWDDSSPLPVEQKTHLNVSGNKRYIARTLASPVTFPLDSASGVKNNYVELNRTYHVTDAPTIHGTDDRAIAWDARYVPSGRATGFDKRLAFKPYMSVSADDVKVAHGYAAISSYEGIANAWVEIDVTGRQPTEIIDTPDWHNVSVTSPVTNATFNANSAFDLRPAFLGRLQDKLRTNANITLRDTLDTDSLSRYVSLSTVTHGGVTTRMDSITLVAGRSTKNVRAHNAHGELAREEHWVYDSTSTWQLAETLIHNVDDFGRVMSIVRRDGGNASERTTYEACYNGLMLDWEKDASGLLTTYQYDGLGRIASKTVSANHGLSTVPSSITTAIKYDAMDRTVETISAGLKQSAEYDAMGLLLSSSDTDGLLTSFTYSREPNSGLRIDISHPGGRSETRVHDRAGNLKSVTGNSVIATNYTYTWDTGTSTYSGTLETRIDSVLPATSTTRHPWIKTRTDWTGRVTRQETPTPVSQNFTRSFIYSPLTRRLDETTETEVSANGASVTQNLSKKFGYNTMGEVNLAGADLNGGGLADSSTDRISRTSTNFVTVNDSLYEETISSFFPEDASATAVTSTSRTRLNGMPTNTLAEDLAIDPNGNSTSTIMSVNRSSATSFLNTTFQDGTSTSSTAVMGLTTTTTSRQGQTTSTTYDSAARPTLETITTGSRSFASRAEYEAGKARMWRVTTALAGDGSGIGQSTVYGYDSAGRVNAITTAEGTANYAYNNRSQLFKSWGDTISPAWYEYDADFGTLLKMHTWPVMAAAAPDLANASTPPAESSIVRFVRDNATGAVTNRTDAFDSGNARITDYTYDALGQLRTVQTPSSTVGTNTVATPRVTATRTYTPKTRELESISFSGGPATPSLAYTWHRSGSLKSVTEGGTNTRIFHYDHSGNGASALRPLHEDLPSYYSTIPSLATNDTSHTATRIKWGYSTTGMRGTMTGSFSGPPGANSTLAATRTATSLGWSSGLLANATADGVTSTFGYESSSSIQNSRSFGVNQETRAFHPQRAFLTQINTSSPSKLHSRQDFIPDQLGRRSTMLQRGVISEMYGGNLHTSFDYDTRSRLTASTTRAGTSATAPNLAGRSFGYDYDLAGNRRLATRPDAPANATSFSWTVDSLNQITTRQTPQWAELSGQLPTHRGIALRANVSTPAVAPTRTHKLFHAYHTPAAGSGVRQPTAELLYAERDAGPPSGAPTRPLVDKIDRRAVPLPLRPSTENLVYDGRGNLVADAFFTYSWDSANRLTAVESSAAAITAGLPKTRLTFLYDWQGRRYAKRNHPWRGTAFAANPDHVTLFWWDGWNLIREAVYATTAWSGSTPTAAIFVRETRYSWGNDLSGSHGGAGGVGGLLSLTTRQAGQAASTPLFPAYDGTGNIVALLDAAGASHAIYEYDPYGKLLRASGAAAQTNPFRFATKYYDAETRLVYHNARYYSPELGRFLGRDPIGEAGGSNLHAYCSNDPVNKVDVLGRQEIRLFNRFTSRDGKIGVGGASNFATAGPTRTIPRTNAEAYDMYVHFHELHLVGMQAQTESLSLSTTMGNWQEKHDYQRLSDATDAAQQSIIDQLGIYNTYKDAQGNLSDELLADDSRIKALMPKVPFVDAQGMGDATALMFAPARAAMVGEMAFGMAEQNLGTGGAYAATAGAMLAQIRGVRNIPLNLLAKSFGGRGTGILKNLPEPYQGVREASQYLKSMNVSRADRVKYLQSFDVSTISVKTAGNATFGYRFHDFGKTARPMGQFLSETFTPLTNRANLALPYQWNRMTGISQWQISPGTSYIFGQVGPQLQLGSQFIGGASQMFVLEPWKYGSLQVLKGF